VGLFESFVGAIVDMLLNVWRPGLVATFLIASALVGLLLYAH
jgi:hypothetical protein